MLHLTAFLLAFVAGAVVPALLLTLALRRWRRLPDEPWTERARHLHPIRTGHGIWLLVFPFSAIVARMWLCPTASLVAVVAGAIFGVALSSWPLDRAVFPSFGFRAWLGASVTLSILRLGWISLVLVFALAMPDAWSLAQVGWAAAFLAASGTFSAGLLHRLLVALGIFRPASPRLVSLVNECAAEAKVAVKSVWELPTPAGFAAALVAQRALIFSTTTANEHDDDELRAICRHELAHLDEGPALVALRVGQTPLTLLPFIFTRPFMSTMDGVGMVVPILLWALLTLLSAKLSLRLEKRADTAARQGGESPAYARALERLHRRNLAPAILEPKTARTHPDLYDRMLAAGVAPDFPRPAPPSSSHWLLVSSQLLSAATMLGWISYYLD